MFTLEVSQVTIVVTLVGIISHNQDSSGVLINTAIALTQKVAQLGVRPHIQSSSSGFSDTVRFRFTFNVLVVGHPKTTFHFHTFCKLRILCVELA